MTASAPPPGIRRLDVDDIVEALAAGVRDFKAAPVYGLAIGGLFAVAGWLLVALVAVLGMPYLAYPLAMGFAIVAPFAAVGFYTVSEGLAAGQPLSWGGVLASIRSASQRDLRWMAFVTGFALVIWMDIAAFTFFAFMGFQSFDADIVERLFTTGTGLAFLILGHLVGAAIALAVFSISAVSFPMLYERDIDFVTAMMTSVRLVLTNPMVMLGWAALIALFLGISILSGFLGLFMAMPVLGHATWHLYKRAIDADAVIASARQSAHKAPPLAEHDKNV